jgi:hypothetical protein
MKITYILTLDIITNGIIKLLGKVVHKRFREQLGLVDSETL